MQNCRPDPKHEKFPETSLVIDKLSLSALQNLMGHMSLVIAMDSLPLHLASTTPTPTFSIFGASSAHKYKPEGLRHGTMQGSCPYGKTFEKRCSILRTCATGTCIRNADATHLYNEFMAWEKGSGLTLTLGVMLVDRLLNYQRKTSIIAIRTDVDNA